MKNNSLLLIAGLAGLVATASAAQSQNPADLIVLPTYVVEAPRYQPVERLINASLNELRQQAHAPMAVAPDFPALKPSEERSPRLTVALPHEKTVRLAKL